MTVMSSKSWSRRIYETVIRKNMDVEDVRNYTLELIAFFREINLFQAFDSEIDEEIYVRLNPYFKDETKIKEYLEDEDLGENYLKKRICQEILILDKSKCLQNHDSEWVYQEGDYIPFMKAVLALSQDSLYTANVVEKWENDTTPSIKITVSYIGGEFLIHPNFMGDWADTQTILSTLNNYLHQAEFLYVFDEDVIIFLSHEQKEAFERRQIPLIKP